jgi:DNA-binding XRE family transcriptional regulator
MNPVLEARLKTGLTRKQVADKLGISDRFLFALEIGMDAIICPGKSLTAEEAVKEFKEIYNKQTITKKCPKCNTEMDPVGLGTCNGWECPKCHTTVEDSFTRERNEGD